MPDPATRKAEQNTEYCRAFCYASTRVKKKFLFSIRAATTDPNGRLSVKSKTDTNGRGSVLPETGYTEQGSNPFRYTEQGSNSVEVRLFTDPLPLYGTGRIPSRSDILRNPFRRGPFLQHGERRKRA